jgi:hypothetical protein
MMNHHAFGLLIMMSSLTYGALQPTSAAAAALGEHRGHRREPPHLGWSEVQRLTDELLERLTSVTSESEVAWRVTQIVLDPRLHELVVGAGEHLDLRALEDLVGADSPIVAEHAHLVELFVLSAKASRATLDAGKHAAAAQRQRVVPPMSSFRERIYDPHAPAWIRIGLFDELSAHFCLAVLLSQTVGEEPRRILATAAKRGFESALRLHVALLAREGRPIPEGIAELGLAELDPDAQQAEQRERDRVLDEWLARS